MTTLSQSTRMSISPILPSSSPNLFDPHWLRSRQVVERIVIVGTLVLDTPTHFGNGDAEGLTDMPLACDPLTGAPLLAGASIAGALRHYLREREMGYGRPEDRKRKQHDKSLAERLFGHIDESEVDLQQTRTNGGSAVQSWLFVDDAIGEVGSSAGYELRDGVAINRERRTASDKQKYDIELLAAGTRFPLRFELWLSQADQDKGDLLQALVTALLGLTSGEVGMGQRKRRGFGECHVEDWLTHRYDMCQASGLLGWLENAEDKANSELGLPTVASLIDQRREFHIAATFAIDGALLIRSDSGADNSIDMAHLQRGKDPILPGTSLAGVLRAHIARIANAVLQPGNAQPDVGQRVTDVLFGRDMNTRHDDAHAIDANPLLPQNLKPQPTGSRILVRERIIDSKLVSNKQVQSRVKIDRLTGGSLPTALFNQQPLWSPEQARATVCVDIRLRHYVDPIDTAEGAADRADKRYKAGIGLLLLALKDLWLGDVTIGGESSVGRGRFIGQSACLIDHAAGSERRWEITGTHSLNISGESANELEKYVAVIAQSAEVWA